MMRKNNRIMSLSAIGLDSPGLVSRISSRIYELAGNIIDVEESSRRGLFYIFLIIDFAASEMPLDQIKNSLKSIEEETDLKIIVGIYDEERINRPVEKENHIITLLGVDKPGIIAKVSGFLHQYNINIEQCRMIARGEFFSMEMVIDSCNTAIERTLTRERGIEKMKGELKELCTKMSQSVVIQSENIYNRAKKLIVFDVESSLIQEFSIKKFLEKIRGKVLSINRKAEFIGDEGDRMQGLVENARMLQGIPMREFENFGRTLQLNPGSLELIKTLKSMGFKIALLSSGFNFFIRQIFEAAGVDYAFSNNLKVDADGIITGELDEPAITSDSKEEILQFIMTTEDINRDQVIAVGDGSSRSHFIKGAGLSIAFRPDEADIKTDGILSSDQIINMLYCFGIPKTELDKYFGEHLKR